MREERANWRVCKIYKHRKQDNYSKRETDIYIYIYIERERERERDREQ